MWIFWSMNASIISWRKTMLANMCDARARMLQDEFNVSKNHLHALAILVSAFHHGKNPSSIDQVLLACTRHSFLTDFFNPDTGLFFCSRKHLQYIQRERHSKGHSLGVLYML
eukprot:TRINITY_DN4834_c0_g2_i13.p1 TRINITY_DN4834_c0_g2~~TRINITY_DN4834_c0_g2_i13.p1  ORF type:complete len:112 (-),score=17.90 TRINITY_DN4834_c0_g2_i13:694-1029(-)